MRALFLVGLLGCKPFAPPPMIAMHAETAASPEGSTTVMLIAGFAGTLFGGGGWGIAVRGEHQVTTRTALGLEVTGGWGDEATGRKSETFKRELYAIRGYGRWSPRSRDWFAATYGVGLSHLNTGLVTGTVQAGAAISYVNDVASPLFQVGLAAALPLVDGEPFGQRGWPNTAPDQPRNADADVFVCIDGGVIGKTDGGSNRFSFDLGFAGGLRSGEFVFGVSAADAQGFGD